MESDASGRTYRERGTWIAFVVTAIGFGAIALLTGWGALSWLLGVAFAAPVVCIVYLVVRRPRVVATSDGITVVQPHRARHVAWPELRDVGVQPTFPKSGGWLLLYKTDGSVVRCFAIQQTYLDLLRPPERRIAERVGQELLSLRDHHLADRPH